MTRYAVLLRGIMPSNPAMANDRLRGVLESLGMEQVASVLASGNLVFTAPAQDVPALEALVQQGLQDELGIPGGTIIRSLEELRALLDSDPFPGLTHGRGTYLTATFLKDGVAAPTDLPDWADRATGVVGFDPAARAFLAVTDNTVEGRTSEFMAWLDQTFGKDITTRTWLTVQRVVRRLENP